MAYTVAWLLVLLGLPGLYAGQRGQMGPLGLVGFLTAFTGTYLIAVTGNFGFLAPVLAKQLHTLTVRLLQVDRHADAVAAAQEAIGRYGDAARLPGADRTKIISELRLFATELDGNGLPDLANRAREAAGRIG